MTLIADLLMTAGALAAGFYCIVLSRRLTALKNVEGGIGQAVAALSLQVDELERSIDSARNAAGQSSKSLTELTARAEGAAQRLELMVASMHDIPDLPDDPPAKTEPEPPLFTSRLGRRAEA